MLTRDDILVALQDAITENQEFELPPYWNLLLIIQK